jgi:HK97 family phage portal protein
MPKWLDRRIVDKALAIVGRSADPSALTINWSQLMGGEWLPTDAAAQAQQAYANVLWVFACVRAKAIFGAMVPLRVYQIPKGGGEEDKKPVAYDHPLQTLLRKVNPRFTRFNLVEQMLTYGNLTGKMIVLKESGKVPGYRPPPDELWTLRPDYLRKINFRKGTALIESFEIGAGGETRILPADQVIYIPSFNPYSDADGLAPTKPLWEIMQTEIYAQTHNKNLLKGGGVPRIALIVEKFLTAIQQKDILKGWHDSYSGRLTGDASQTALAFGGVKPQVLAQTALEMDMAGQGESNRQKIMSAFGCNNTALGLPNANYATAKAEMEVFAKRTMQPELTPIAEHFTEFLAPDFGERLIVAFDYSQVEAFQADPVAMGNLAVAAVGGNNPLMSPNMALAHFLGLPPRKGGDVILVPMTLVEGGSGATEAPRAKRDTTAVTHTPAQAKRWANYVRRVDVLEGHARKWLREAFEAQQGLCQMALDGHRSRRALDELEDELVSAGFSAPTREALKKILWAAAKEGIEHGNEPLADLGLGFDLDNPALVKFLSEHAYDASKMVNDTTTEALRTILSNAEAEGGTLKEIEDRVRDAMNAMFDKDKAGRAKTIARTEVQIGVQHTQQTAWKASEVVEKKQWISSMSPKMRQAHGSINGQEVGLDEPFVMVDDEFGNGRVEVMYPGDETAGCPGMTINCLCDMAPVVSEKAKMDFLGRKLERKLYPATGKGSRTWETKENVARLLLSR